MNNLGVNLKVDAQAVKEARRDLEWLNKSLHDVEKADLSLGGEELSRDAEMLRRVSMELTRLGQLSRAGENRGGILNVKQFQDAANLSKQIGTNLGGWLATSQKLRAELKEVTGDLNRLQKDSLSPGLSPSARNLMIEDMAVLEGRRDSITNELKGRAKHDTRAGFMSQRAQEFAGNIGGYGQAPEAGGGDAAILALGRKAFGVAATILGVGSGLSILRSSWNQDKSQEELETGLRMRGITSYDRRVSPWNYTPREEAETIMALRRTTGAGDMGTLSSLERFSRLGNIDPMTSLGVAGSYYQATGADPSKQQRALDALLFMGKQAKDGRTETLLGLINANLIMAHAAQGGKALSQSQVSHITQQTVGMYNAAGTQGMNSNVFSTMQNALNPSGEPVSELMAWDIIGGFKGGPLTPERMVDLQRLRAQGLNNPENRRRFNAQLKGRSRAEQILRVQMLLRSFNMPGGVQNAEAYLDWYGPSGRLPATSGDAAGLLDKAASEYRATQGYRIGQTNMETEIAKLNVGDVTETAGRGMLHSLTKGIAGGTQLYNAHKYDPLIMETARRYGVRPAWLLSMVMNESGGNSRLTSKKGAQGLLQVMPGTFSAYGRKGGNVWDPADNLDAGAKYFSHLLNRYKGNYEAATIAYNEGEGAYDKGLRYPESLQYLTKVKKQAGLVSVTGGLGGWGDIPTDSGSSTEALSLWKKMEAHLELIATKIGHTNFSPAKLLPSSDR